MPCFRLQDTELWLNQLVDEMYNNSVVRSYFHAAAFNFGVPLESTDSFKSLMLLEAGTKKEIILCLSSVKNIDHMA